MPNLPWRFVHIILATHTVSISFLHNNIKFYYTTHIHVYMCTCIQWSRMPGLDSDNPSNGSSHLPSSSPSSSSTTTGPCPTQRAARNRTSTEWNSDHTTIGSSSPLLLRQPASEGSCDGHVTTTEGGVRKFTWKELSQLYQRHNAHVAYRGKVCAYTCTCECVCYE